MRVAMRYTLDVDLREPEDIVRVERALIELGLWAEDDGDCATQAEDFLRAERDAWRRIPTHG